MLLELFSGGSRLEIRAGWRWMMVMILELELTEPVCLRACLSLPRAGGPSPPYIGDGLGFWVRRKLQDCPYDINYSLVRLELVVMILYRGRPRGSTGGCPELAHQYGAVGWLVRLQPSRTLASE